MRYCRSSIVTLVSLAIAVGCSIPGEGGKGGEPAEPQSESLRCLNGEGEEARQAQWPQACFPDELGETVTGVDDDGAPDIEVKFENGVVSSVNGMSCLFCSYLGQPKWADVYESGKTCSQWLFCGEQDCRMHLRINAFADPPYWTLTGGLENETSCPEFYNRSWKLGPAEVEQPCFAGQGCGVRNCGTDECGQSCGTCAADQQCRNGFCESASDCPSGCQVGRVCCGPPFCAGDCVGTACCG